MRLTKNNYEKETKRDKKGKIVTIFKRIYIYISI